MANPSKKKGTEAENQILRWVREHGFPWAELLRTAGARDIGDISLLPGRAVIIESKWHESAARGQVTPGVLIDWLAQTERERVQAGADFGVLVVKRGGTTNAGMFWAYLTLAAFTELLGATGELELTHPEAPVCFYLADVVRLLRARGYGEAL